MKNNEKVELLLHYDEPIIITKDKFDEFEHKFSGFLDPENYLDFGSCVYQALEALNFLDPNGKYFLYAEYAVYDEDWDAYTGLFECALVNCDCPDFLKNKFDGEFLIT